MSATLVAAIAVFALLSGLFVWQRRRMLRQPLEPNEKDLAKQLRTHDTAAPDADEREVEGLPGVVVVSRRPSPLERAP